jgi:hypothetical protein
MNPIQVGCVPTGEPEPYYVAVMRDGTPFARIDAYRDHRGPFTELITWGRFIVLGWAAVVHLVDPLTRQVRNIDCDFYFGHLYPIDNRLYIATTSELICIDEIGNVNWNRGNLGIDGVTVTSTNDGIVRGEGEWDPPGGWRPFRLSLDTGVPLPE